jgi:hypothetical protein
MSSATTLMIVPTALLWLQAERAQIEKLFSLMGRVVYVNDSNPYPPSIFLPFAANNASERTVDHGGDVPDIPETHSYVRCITDAYLGTTSIPLAAQPFEDSLPIRRELESQGRTVVTNE